MSLMKKRVFKNEIDVSMYQDSDDFVSFVEPIGCAALNCFQARGAETDHQPGRAGPRQLEAGAVPRRYLAGLLLLRVEGGQVYREGELCGEPEPLPHPPPRLPEHDKFSGQH